MGKPKDKNAPKKPQTAYFVMCNEKRNEIKASLEKPTMAAVSKKMGEMWKTLSDEQRQYYNQKNLEQKERYAEEFAKYKETDNFQVHQDKLKEFQKQKSRAYSKRSRKDEKKCEKTVFLKTKRTLLFNLMPKQLFYPSTRRREGKILKLTLFTSFLDFFCFFPKKLFII